MTTTYYRFEIDGEPQGLVRMHQSPELGSIFAYVGDRGWVIDQQLLGRLVDPGDIILVEVSPEEAKAVAEGFGVALDAEPTHSAPMPS